DVGKTEPRATIRFTGTVGPTLLMPDGKQFLAVGDGSLRRYDLETGKLLKTIPIKVPGWSADVYHLALTADEKSAVAIVGDRRVKNVAMIDLESGTIKRIDERSAQPPNPTTGGVGATSRNNRTQRERTRFVAIDLKGNIYGSNGNGFGILGLDASTHRKFQWPQLENGDGAVVD